MSKLERLSRLSRLLKAERDPFYVTFPLPPGLRREYPCEGWYWKPAGTERVQLLARDSYDAYHQLLSMIEALDQEEEPTDEQPAAAA